jgi:RimJ/RimL family protein N-acetyltransferase
MLTERLEIRPPAEPDREPLVQLLTDAAFMVFSDGVYDLCSANAHIDHLLALNRELAFAKQPIVERSSGRIVGYAGADWFDLNGSPQLEFGYRLAPHARGRGYATEASAALLSLARQTWTRPIYAIIHEPNVASIRTAERLGFRYTGQTPVNGAIRNLYLLSDEQLDEPATGA